MPKQPYTIDPVAQLCNLGSRRTAPSNDLEPYTMPVCTWCAPVSRHVEEATRSARSELSTSDMDRR